MRRMSRFRNMTELLNVCAIVSAWVGKWKRLGCYLLDIISCVYTSVLPVSEGMDVQ